MYNTKIVCTYNTPEVFLEEDNVSEEEKGFIRDAIYNLIAANRYKWFGKKESCMIPTPALKSRFLN